MTVTVTVTNPIQEMLCGQEDVERRRVLLQPDRQLVPEHRLLPATTAVSGACQPSKRYL